MRHEEANELLGAYALDAVDGSELVELEAHLDACPRCRAELDGLRDVAGALGNSVEPPPEGLWSQIAGQLPERPEEHEPPPMPRLVADDAGRSETEGSVSSSSPSTPFRTPSSPNGRRRRGVVTLLAAAGVAAAAVAVVLGIGLVRADNNVSNLQAQSGQPATVRHALATPGRQLVDLYASSGEAVARFVVVPDGRGYLLSSSLPALGAGQTYQLWGIVGSQPISLGLLGQSPHQAVFTMAGSNRPSRLSITAEPAGGVIMPTSAIVATGSV